MAKGFTDKSARGLNQAVKEHPGRFAAKAERAGMSTRAYADKEKNAPGTLGEEARLALRLMDMNHSGKKRRK